MNIHPEAFLLLTNTNQPVDNIKEKLMRNSTSKKLFVIIAMETRLNL